MNPSSNDRARMRVAIGFLVALALVTALAFARSLPIGGGTEIEAVFSSRTHLRTGSPVRIAGVTVGKVSGFRNGPGTTQVVTLKLDDAGLPVHADASAKIRPRLFLEGDFYVELRPGSPSARELADGGRIPLARTAVPVQLNDVLGALRHPTRVAFRRVLDEVDVALARGGADGLRLSARPLAPALRDGAIAARALRGVRAHDLSTAIRSSSRLTAALASRDRELAELVSGLNTATGALAAEQRPVAASLRGLAALARETPPQLDALDRTLPSVTRFAAALRPGLRAAPPVLAGGADLLRQLAALAGPRELPALLTQLEPGLRALPSLERRLAHLLGKVTPVTDCVRDRVAPVLEARLDDGALSTNRPVWQDAVHALTSSAGVRGFDANGDWLRLIGFAGERTVAVGTTLPSGDAALGAAPLPIAGTRPQPLPPGRRPPIRSDVACRGQRPVDLRAATGPAPPQQESQPVPAGPTADELSAAVRALLADQRRRR